MAMKRISDLTATIGALVGTELLELETAGGSSKKATAQAIANLAPAIAASAPAGLQYAAATVSIADAAPGAGKLSWNHATQASATVLYVDDTTADAATLASAWGNLAAGGLVFLQCPANAAKWQFWKVTTITDAIGYAKLGVVLLGKGVDLVDGDPIRLTLASGAAPSVQTLASAASVTPLASNDKVVISALGTGLTLANPSGAAAEGQGFVIAIYSAAAQTIAFGADYRAMGAALPTTTVAGKWIYIPVERNHTDSKWDVFAVSQQA